MSDSACPRAAVWLPGLTRRDRLFLWWLAYRLHPACSIELATLRAACQKCRYPYPRALELVTRYPQAWQRMLEKRRARILKLDDPHAKGNRVSGALIADLKCRHPRMYRKVRQTGLL